VDSSTTPPAQIHPRHANPDLGGATASRACDNAGVTDISLPYFSARPEDESSRAGVVVIHEGGGISSQLLRFCERLAQQGYAAVAPDLFFRAGGPEGADFGTLIGSLDRQRTQGDLDSMAALLRRQGARKVGVTGFCMGGRWTWRTAVAGEGFDAAVGFYGGGIAQDLGVPKVPTLLFFGGTDEWIPSADIETVQSHHENTIVYPEAGHGFMRDGSESYHEESANDAWPRMLDFFGEHLT
jgi:carboxymethylenebutenolidase